MSRNKRSQSAMDLDASQSTITSDVSMQGSSSTIRGGSLMQIDVSGLLATSHPSPKQPLQQEPRIHTEPNSRERKIRILTALDMEPKDRQRIHALEDLVAAKNTEIESAALEIKSRDTIITALERKVSSMRTTIEEAQEHLATQEVLNQGAWAKANDLDKTRKQAQLIGRVYDLDQEAKDLQERLSTQWAESEKTRSASEILTHTLEVECHDLKTQMTALIDSNSKLSSANTQLQQTTKSLEKLTKKLQDEDITILETSLADSVAKCDDLRNLVETTKTEVLSLQNSMNVSKELANGLQSDNKRLRESITLLQQQKTVLEDKLSTSSKEMNRFVNENNQLHTNISNAQSRQSSLQSKYQETEEKLHRADHEKILLEEDNQQLSNDLGILKEDHEALKVSCDGSVR
ncbi:hypothetical protein F5877DRAFT_83922 [Lentinula edodes]|nr:hypothetical protein F5877DRAFT_83922 [Lentinula edodes]